ncbi:MAG: 50S ribosomal protein L2 [Candidatus Nealsonbacteria bacterium]|nr:50S ribosomal protein L2 [Candidatus Nealsonbacteria bacterium]
MLKNQATKENFRLLTKKEPEKGLLLKLQKRAGRAHTGRITMRHQGGGAKQLYRIVDFGEQKINQNGKVVALEYDPNRTSFIILVQYDDGEKRYRLAPQNVKVGDAIMCAEKTEIKPGNTMKLKNIPSGTQVHNVEIEPGRGGKLIRGAGAAAEVLSHEGKYAQLRMPSTEIRKILEECFATVGAVSRPEHMYMVVGKAGKMRHKGVRPTVRGSAMIPPDHPHGGGEGRAPIGLSHPKTPWGKIAKGVKTRKRIWTDKYIIERRKKK